MRVASLLMLVSIYCATVAGQEFTDVRMSEPFGQYLRDNPLLMESSGAVVVKLGDGKTLVLAVASRAVKDNSAGERLISERVCRAKAIAYVVGEKNGVAVAHTEKVRDRTVIVIENGKEQAASVSDYFSLTETKIQGIARGMPIVGKWRSADGEIFYLAVGVILKDDGNASAEQ